MKRIGSLVLMIAFFALPVDAQSKKNREEMVFDKTIDGITAHDFGSIVFGANGKVEFTFTNQGSRPLIISDVKSSCGCAVPGWTKEPVEPGKQGMVDIQYNTSIPGSFNKTVVVYSNANNSPIRIEIRGKVSAQGNDLKPGTTSRGVSANNKPDIASDDSSSTLEGPALNNSGTGNVKPVKSTLQKNGKTIKVPVEKTLKKK